MSTKHPSHNSSQCLHGGSHRDCACRACAPQHNCGCSACRVGSAKAIALSSRQAIVVSFRGPTGGARARGARLIAKCASKRISVPWDDNLDPGGNHAAAALQLMDQLGWSERNDLVMGGTREGYVFVQVPKRST
jgi:hypothetical protein